MNKVAILQAKLLMRRADIELSYANLCLDKSHHEPDGHFHHTKAATEYLNQAEAIIRYNPTPIENCENCRYFENDFCLFHKEVSKDNLDRCQAWRAKC